MKINKVEINNKVINYQEFDYLYIYRFDTIETKEPETIEWLRKNLNSSSVFYDVGANVGIFTLYASALNLDCQIFAFEPEHRNYSQLSGNIRLNKLTDRVTPCNLGISDAAGIASFALTDKRYGNSGGQLSLEKPLSNQSKIMEEQRVLSINLDALVCWFNLPIPTIIKVDIDGLEFSVLKGADKIKRTESCKSDLLEIDSPIEHEKIENFLLERNYMQDEYFNSLKNHSKYRREKSGQRARNYVYKKK